MKSFSTRASNLMGSLCWGLLLISSFASPVSAQPATNYVASGVESAVVGSLPADQMFPDAALSPGGGFVVWQDPITDGNGWGISARRLNSIYGAFRVNAVGAGSQENPRVALLKNGGAVFVWQGGIPGLDQHIYARFLTPTNTFLGPNDLRVNTYPNHFQINPAVAVLNNSNVVVVWASYNQAGSNSLQDVYGQILSPAGQKLGGEFLVNQTIAFNQRNPAVTALATGGFAVAWVSEQQRQSVVPGTNGAVNSGITPPSASVDICARLFDNGGAALGNEFLVNADLNPCANPAIAAATDGRYLIVWMAKDLAAATNSLDIYGRAFLGNVGGAVLGVNSQRYGDQYLPRVNALGLDYLVTWTSLGQDGDSEGIFGQFLHSNGSLSGGEFRVNTTTVSVQKQPAVASDGVGQFMVVWSGYTGYPNTFDLFAQRYQNTLVTNLPVLSAPFVWAPFELDAEGYYLPQLIVTWASQESVPVAKYQVFVDGLTNTPAAEVTSNQWVMTALAGSTHAFQVGYVTPSGAASPLSLATSAKTWGGDDWFGIPAEWVKKYYGTKYSNWPANVDAPLVPGGPSLGQVFLSGGNPTNAATWLRSQLVKTPAGLILSWNSQPGATYQVQVSTNLGSWVNFGLPLFAAGLTDQSYVGGSQAAYYRVLLLR